MERRQLFGDALLAAATCAVLLGGCLSLGVDAGVFLEPLSAVLGCLGMVGLEAVLLRNPTLTRRLWDRPPVRAGSALGLLVGAGLAASLGAVWIVAVLVWGLLAYLGLVGVVLVRGHNPLAPSG